jgi:uncharacterized phage infection (PIP) family protein YhgE
MSASEKAKNLWDSFTGFLNKHTGDLRAIASALTTVNNALPIDAHDKERINDAINAVEDSVTNIHDWLAGATAPDAVVIKQSDLVHAVSDYLNSDAGKELLASVVNEGNGNA